MSARIRSLSIRKPIAQIREDAHGQGLSKSLGPINLLMLGIGSIIGAGIYVMTGAAAAHFAGPAVLISFLVAGTACAFAGLCYAELASSMPVTGSAYVYAYATLGELVAWAIGWLLVLEYAVAGATVAVGFSGYLVSLFTTFGVTVPTGIATPFVQTIVAPGGYDLVTGGGVNLLASGAVLLMATPLIFGVRQSAAINTSIVALKIIVLLAFVVFGASAVLPTNWTPFMPENEGGFAYGWPGVFRAASVIFFAYLGFETVSTAAAEARNPQRDIPFGVLGSLCACTLLYIAVAVVLTGVVPYRELGVADPLAVAVDVIGKPWLLLFVKIGAVIGLTSILLSTCYAQSRIFYAMARDGLLPPMFSALHPRFQTPWLGTIVIACGMALAAGLLPITLLGDLISLGTATSFAIVCFSVMWLHNAEPDLPRPFRVPFGGVRIAGRWIGIVPVAGIVMCLVMVAPLALDLVEKAINGDLLPAGLLLGYVGCGALVYIFYGRRHSRLGRGMRPRATPPADLDPLAPVDAAIQSR
ncbi:amino acid permease [Sphingomonas sp. SRS2]|uniref:amino acid permease n=1 Tax=Sphingomonas sp. SRS2 TaxID=133190 RepID=UPI0006184804|nr:amino acid permease [Sphingomonas sp. SRS2]KKC25562.1 amino acid permease [Sphingomonas sp. SRS2]